MAQLAISKDYFAAYARLPRKAQRKADEFLSKFQGDSTAASIHLEPLQRTVDTMLRSARIGDDYRVILRAPEKGDVFLILWADHHDEAYRWAATKQTAVHPHTGSLQIFDAVHATQAVTTSLPDEPVAPTPSREQQKEPAEPAGLFAARSDDDLFLAGVPRALLPSVRAIETEEELDLLLPHLPPEAAEVLTALAAGLSLDDALEEVLGRSPPPVGAPAPPPVDVTDVAAALDRETTQRQFRLFDGSLDLDSALKHPLDVWRVFLHPRQRRIAHAHTKGPVRVLGGAGTGKTVVALHRAAFLVRDVFTKPDDRVLFTTFTTNLAEDIRSQLGKLLEPDQLARVEVVNIDKWASQFLRNRGKPVRQAFDQQQKQHFDDALEVYGTDEVRPDFYRAEWRDVVQEQGLRTEEEYVATVRKHRGVPLGRAERRRLWPVFAAYRNNLDIAGMTELPDVLRLARTEVEVQRAEDGGTSRYRAVVVDEAQDFSADALRLVRAIAGPERPDDLFLVGDAHQRIYGRPVSLTACGIQVRGRRSQTLRLNYRTTGAICRWSLGMLKDVEVDDLDEGTADRRGYVSVREGPAPTIRVFGSAREEEAALVSSCQELIAAGVPASHVCVVCRTHKPLEDRFGPALERAGVPTVVLEGGEPRKDGVRLSTMHRVKGLEFPYVFLVDVSRGHVPLPTDELRSDDAVVAARALLRERSLLYVAASRARDELHVSAAGAPSVLLEGLLRPRSVIPARRPSAQALAAVAPPPKPPTAPPPAPPTSPAPDPLAPASQEPAAPAHEVSPSAAIANALATPLADIDMSARLVNWAARTGVTTLGGLAARAPQDLLAERNMGRTSVKEARAIIESRTGASWEDLLAGIEESAAVPVAGHVAAASSLTLAEAAAQGKWDAVRRLLSDAQRGILLEEVQLPARVVSYSQLHGMKTVGDLADKSAAELVAAPNMARKSVKDLCTALQDFLESLRAEEALADLGLVECWKALLQGLDQMPRIIVSRRSGMAGEVATLQELGDVFGVSRERIRQLEAKAANQLGRRQWSHAARRRVEAALIDGAVPLRALEQDPWWAGAAGLPHVLRFIVQDILEVDAHIAEVDDQPWLARVNQQAVAAAWRGLSDRAEALELPAPATVIDELVAPLVDSLGARLAAHYGNELRERAQLDGQERILALGDDRASRLLAMLRSSPAPLRQEDVETALGGRIHLPEEVLHFGRGLIGLKQHIEDFDAWRSRLVPRSVAIIQRDGPERQWSTSELLEALREEEDIPAWLGPWVLVALIRAGEELTYLGRGRVALAGEDGSEGRVFVHDVVEDLLRVAGAPLDKQRLLDQLRARVAVTEYAFPGIFQRPQFVRMDADRVGLMDRDVPGGAGAINEAAEHAENALSRRGRGLSSRHLHREIQLLSDPHSMWTEELTSSVLRADGRFRFSQTGAIGLASWESTRVPTRLELIRSALDEAGGRVSVEAVLSRIEAHYGERPVRASLPPFGMKLGAVLDGEWLTRARQPQDG